MAKIIKLTEKELTKLVKKVINEQGEDALPAAQQDQEPEIECYMTSFIGGNGVFAEVEYNGIIDGAYFGVKFIIDGSGNVTIKHGNEIGFEQLTNKSITAKIFKHFSDIFHYDQTESKIGSGVLFLGKIKMDGSIDTDATFEFLD